MHGLKSMRVRVRLRKATKNREKLSRLLLSPSRGTTDRIESERARQQGRSKSSRSVCRGRLSCGNAWLKLGWRGKLKKEEEEV